MRFGRIGPRGEELPGALDNTSTWRDLSSFIPDIRAHEFRTGAIQALVEAELDLSALPALNPVRLGPPIADIGKIICVGLNYAAHVSEAGAEYPLEPVLFMKAPDTVTGPYDDLILPPSSTKTDWEVELAVVIGSVAAYLRSPDDAIECIGGYTISNDVSERHFQLERGGQWAKGKNFPTFNPLGPWLVTPDEFSDPGNVALTLSVNGIERQNSTTMDLIFNINHLVWYISQCMTLYPGDVINTGTPAGVALGSDDVPYLADGDVIDVAIEGLGTQRQHVITAHANGLTA